MKKMISVPVGAEPKISKYRYGSNNEYIDYGWTKETIYPAGKLKGLISELQRMLEKYRDRYQNMHFEERNDCGCPHECSCSPTYVLYGERYETDLEYNFRLKQEARMKEEREAREKAEYEKLKAKFG